MSVLSWTSANYLGHANLKAALNTIKRSRANVALSVVDMTLQPTTVSGFGRGGLLRLGTTANSTFIYRIEDTFYLKGSGAVSALQGDTTPCLLPHNPDLTVDQTAAYAASDITAGYYRAGALLIDASGNFSVVVGELTGRVNGIGTAASGARELAISKLSDVLTSTILSTKAIVALYVIGDGTNAFTSTSTLTIATNIDIYRMGGMAISSGLSNDGFDMLGLL